MSRPAIDAHLAAVLVADAIAGKSPEALLESLCGSLVSAGVPLVRASVGALLVHPLLDATLVIWRADRGAYLDNTARPAVRGNEAWRHSPFHRMQSDHSKVLRCRLDRGEGVTRYAILADVAAEGATDYLALRTQLAAGVTLGEGTSIYSSWITDRAGGFTPADLDLVRGIEPVLAVLVAAALGTATAGTLLATYLGADAARRVLSGDVERGRVEMIQAVIWYSDLAGFTRLTDRVSGAGMLQMYRGHAEVLSLLNDYAEILVDAIEGRGGQVLKFMGDGILAIFQAPSDADACEAALGAWLEASRRSQGLRHRAAETHPYLALHAGEVLYGNIGGRARLDFTVLGPAVNEAARIAAMCRSLDRSVVMSESFAELCPPHRRESLVALGRHTLRGVARSQMLFGLQPPAES